MNAEFLTQAHPLLGTISQQQFLEEYWQKKPLLIRQAIPNFCSHLSPEELAGLSCESEIESRLVVENGDRCKWQCHHGPFSEADFKKLTDKEWTLLIQSADIWIPEISDLLQKFDFLPNWRKDDIMISYAADGGSVGPHFDQYDVFLLQAEGVRNWKVGQNCSDNEPTLTNSDLSILEQFNEQFDWDLHPGDMLYLPPQLAHYGRAKGPCITYSIGFRAPSLQAMLERLVDNITPILSENIRFTDASRPTIRDLSEIDEYSINTVRNMIIDQVLTSKNIGEALASLTTESKYPDGCRVQQKQVTGDQLESILANAVLERNPHRRMAFQIEASQAYFYIDGENYVLENSDERLLAYLSSNYEYDGNCLLTLMTSKESTSLIIELLEFEDMIPVV